VSAATVEQPKADPNIPLDLQAKIRRAQQYREQNRKLAPAIASVRGGWVNPRKAMETRLVREGKLDPEKDVLFFDDRERDSENVASGKVPIVEGGAHLQHGGDLAYAVDRELLEAQRKADEARSTALVNQDIDARALEAGVRPDRTTTQVKKGA